MLCAQCELQTEEKEDIRNQETTTIHIKRTLDTVQNRTEKHTEKEEIETENK